MRALAAESALLDAAERCCGVGHQTPIDGDHAGLQPARHGQSALQIAAVDIGREPRSVLLAAATASSSVSNAINDATGPKISSRTIADCGSTPTRTVGE